MNDDVKILIERVNRMTEEMFRIRRALDASMNGIPFNEIFDDEIYLEAADRTSRALTYLSLMIEHLLKLAYSDSQVDYDRNNAKWISDINRHHENAYIELGWYTDENKGVINKVSDRIQDAYIGGIKLYAKASKTYPDLVKGKSLMPLICPWTLEQLMDDDINELLQKLPNRIERV
jgi:hypothetical protein